MVNMGVFNVFFKRVIFYDLSNINCFLVDEFIGKVVCVCVKLVVNVVVFIVVGVGCNDEKENYQVVFVLVVKFYNVVLVDVIKFIVCNVNSFNQ